MPPSAPVDPRATVRAQLAYTLRALRTLSGLSQDQLAKELYATRESIAAYESGRNRPDAEFCAKLDGHFGTGEMFQGLWHHARREHLREWFEEYVGHETAATEIRTFEPLYIPGLLQTEGYIRAASRPNTVIEEGVAQRLARRDILTRDDDPAHLFAVIDQATIVRPVGDRAVMREQLRHLLTMSELPNVSIQVVELESGGYFGLSGALVVLTKPDAGRVGYVEAQFGGRLIGDPGEVARLGLRFDQIRGAALPEEASRTLIAATMETVHDDPVAEEQPQPR
jgi:DNA-binding XRE family transcriptional regulator